MTSKERVIKTIQHKEPDRVPIGEFGIDHDHVSKILGRHTYWRNRKDTTLALWEGRRDEIVESMKHDYAELVEKLDYDLLAVELVPPRGYKPEDPPRKAGEGIWEDSRGNVYKYAASNDSIVCVTQAPGKEEISEEEQKEYENIQFDDSVLELVDFVGDRYGDEKAVLCRGIDIHGILMKPFGGDFNHQLIISSTAPEEIKKMYKAGLLYNRKIIEHCASHKVLIAMQGHDFGMNTGLMISPHMIRDVFFPFMNMVNKEIYEYGMIPFFHSCGRIWDILEDYVKAGYLGYQSIQESVGMEYAKVKAMYGEKMTLWAGVQCETLVSGSLQDVEAEVSHALEHLMPGGGFIFGSTNSVQYGAKTDNYLKALEIIRSKGTYK